MSDLNTSPQLLTILSKFFCVQRAEQTLGVYVSYHRLTALEASLTEPNVIGEKTPQCGNCLDQVGQPVVYIVNR